MSQYPKDISYTVSSRSMQKGMGIEKYLSDYFENIPLHKIDSFFGFVSEFTPLYGGRFYDSVDTMTDLHINEMKKYNIGVSLTLTNHYFSEELYQQTFSILQKFHSPINSIVCMNDDLAKRIREEFPLYKLKASLIKNLDTLEKVTKAFELYDYVVIPMEMNDNAEFLKSLPSKERVILFANANCAYNCENRICYKAISNFTAEMGKNDLGCSQTILPREHLGHTTFDVNSFVDMGFKKFKLVPNPRTKRTLKETEIIERRQKLVFYLFSMPKTGRTWLRFILANYLNLLYNLNLSVDLNSMFHVIPNDGLEPSKGKDAYKYMEDKRFPLLIMSHKNLMNISPLGHNIIVLLRLVYDVMVSDYFQHRYYLKIFDEDLKTFIRLEHGVLQQYCNFMNALEGKQKYILFMTYETMQEEMQTSLESLLHFLKIPLDANYLQQSIELSKFENMQQIEKDFGFIGKEKSNNNPNAFRVREGKVNGYKKYLDEEDILYIRNFCDINLNDSAKDILQKLNISPLGIEV